MSNLTDTAEPLMLDWITNVGSPTRPPGLKVRLMASNGSDSAAGTEITAGGGYTAGGETIAFDAAATVGGVTTAANQAVSWTNMPAATISGAEIWDTSGSPRRLWWGPLTAAKTVNAGDTFQFAAAAAVLRID